MQQDVIKKIKSRILMINENIRGNIYSLSLEDNFDQESVALYQEWKEHALQIDADASALRVVVQKLDSDVASEITAMKDSLKLKVKKADVCSELSVEDDGIYVVSKYFLCDTTNFKVTKDSVYMKGIIYALSGNIGGWEISGNALVGTKDQYGNASAIDGGTIEALSASGKSFAFTTLDFNPEHEEDYHEIDLSNATIFSSGGESSGIPTSFGDLTVHGAVDLSVSLSCGELHCTSLRCQSSSGSYQTIYCDEIITNDESFSDRRLKEDIRYLDPAEGRSVMALRPVRFTYRRGNRKSSGFIAQEIMEALPEYADMIVEEQKGYYGISERQLIPLMILQIQQNIKRLKELKDGKENIKRFG